MDHELDLLSVRGADYWDQKTKLQKIRKALLPSVPKGARLTIRENDHELGYYPSLVVIWKDELPEEAVRAVFALEGLALEKAEELEIEC